MSVFFKKTRTVIAYISKIYLDSVLRKNATVTASITNITVV